MPFEKHGRRIDEWSRKIHDMLDEMSNRIFFEFRPHEGWQPRINVYASRSTYVICIELAGLEPDALRVECRDETTIRLSGQRGRPLRDGLELPCSVEALEIDEGPFSREISLPEPVDAQAAEVSYDRGYLWVILPRLERE
ncbi:MAG: Hsp20/alpha crystallin family protein [Phycisphaerales bacterium]|nr:Hsp20/alpha crystallin family protein [Phycisphaerales bacterium]